MNSGMTRWKMVPSYRAMLCFLACVTGLVQSLVPFARPMKFATPMGAIFGNSTQWRSPAVVWMMAVGSGFAGWAAGGVAGCAVDAACAAPNRDVAMIRVIRTNECSRVRMDAPVRYFGKFLLYDSRSELCRWSLPLESRVPPPGFTVSLGRTRTPVAPSKHSSCTYGRERLLDALRKRLVGEDRGFWVRDGFETTFHFEVERE